MDPESKEKLDRALKLAEENNKMLKKVRSYIRWNRVWQALYWIFIIGSVLGAYYFIQPYVEKFASVYTSAQSDINNLNSIFGGIKKQ